MLLALNPCERNTFSKRFENVSEIPCERKRFLKRFKLKRFIRNVLENALRVNAAQERTSRRHCVATLGTQVIGVAISYKLKSESRLHLKVFYVYLNVPICKL